MEIKAYIKEKVAGVVVKFDDEIVGMIHARYNKDYDAFEIKRIATTQPGMGKELYFLLSIALKEKYIIPDTLLTLPKALLVWDKIKTGGEWEQDKYNGLVRFRVRPLPSMDMEIIYLSFLDVDWFRSILFFRERMISSLESLETNLSLSCSLSVVATKKVNGQS